VIDRTVKQHEEQSHKESGDGHIKFALAEAL
jgi:hypothetical protein